MPIPIDLIEVLTHRSGGRDVMGLTLAEALAEYEEATKVSKPSPMAEMPICAQVDACCFACRGLLPSGTEAVFVHGKGIRHTTCSG